ncbi:HNH endonuclease [Butyrivibrio sp. WCD2001]|uniref:HNH endonuclease n=1 Tax=Butyrivibrio sp. WCD2001 TaxID=1280681 RepID=UPI00040A4CAE|nr:HNH endonuclease signature motif containing protein [Butyrivibrio sp. WCD2001]
MPRKPRRGCAWNGCPRLAEEGGQYCEEHKKIAGRRYEKYERDPATKQRYGRSWQKIRDIYAKAHPYCELCYEKGFMVPMEHVHHKKPLAEGGTNDFDNLQSLCKSCHSRIHSEHGVKHR